MTATTGSEAEKTSRIAYVCVTVVMLAILAFWYREYHEQGVNREACVEATRDICQCANANVFGTGNQLSCSIVMPAERNR